MESLQTIQKTASELIDELFPETKRDLSPGEGLAISKAVSSTPYPEEPPLDR